MSTDTNVELHGAIDAAFEDVLTPGALAFVSALQREFGPRRQQLLHAREQRRARLAAGEMLDFLDDTRKIRESDWRVAPVPDDMQQRWVEITGPTDRKLVINALNSGADGFMADFEDANAPTWRNMVEGHINLRDAIDGTIKYRSSDGRDYRLDDDPATLLVRPRGWHLPERHMLVDSEPVSGSLFDFGLYFFHCTGRLLANGSGPYFYLPKMESHLEARLWNDVFCFAQDELGVPTGHDQGDGADRDAAGGVRDGRDPLRAARPFRRPQRGSLGLHLLVDQVLPRPARDGASRPRRRDHDRAVHARVCRAAGGDVPSARRPRDGRDGGADPVAQGRGGKREGA